LYTVPFNITKTLSEISFGDQIIPTDWKPSRQEQKPPSKPEFNYK
jgi:hypothetical protein